MFFGGKEMLMWEGVVEDRKDPLMMGRVRVRCIGYHDEDKQKMPTDTLPWALILSQPDDMKNVVGYKEGDQVVGYFRDGESKQVPVVTGKLFGIPEKASDPEMGFNDPTPDSDLVPGKVARPPEMIPPPGSEAAEGESDVPLGKYDNPDKLPIVATSTGQLESEFGKLPYPFDENGDGVYNAADATLLIKPGTESGDEGEFFDGTGGSSLPVVPISRYPLEDRLKESLASRLARNENIDKTIVAVKKGNLTTGPTASHKAIGVGTDEAAESETFGEPETPYNAVYPFNHVQESEAGHIRETDDTPGAERLHDFHRSGGFNEIHPDGKEVHKVVNDFWEVIKGIGTIAAEKDLNITALEVLRALGAKIVNIEAGTDLNTDSGRDRNSLVGRNVNTKVLNNVYIVVKGDVRILVEGNIFCAAEGDMKFKAKGNILMDAKNIKHTASDDFVAEGKNTTIQAHQINSLQAGAAVVTEGPLTYTNTLLTDGILIRARYSDTALQADGTGLVIPVPPAVPPLPHENFEEENDADNKDDVISSITPKEGYLLNDGSVVKGSVLTQDLYKPKSDSDGKAVVLTLALGQQARLYEALPTGELQDVTLQYKHLDGTITEWNVKRPVHKKGRFIEGGTYKGNGNGGRDHWRFSKAGAKYPTPMILAIGTTEYILVESGVRHEAL